jgi:hypothetical protein
MVPWLARIEGSYLDFSSGYHSQTSTWKTGWSDAKGLNSTFHGPFCEGLVVLAGPPLWSWHLDQAIVVLSRDGLNCGQFSIWSKGRVVLEPTEGKDKLIGCTIMIQGSLSLEDSGHHAGMKLIPSSSLFTLVRW